MRNAYGFVRLAVWLFLLLVLGTNLPSAAAWVHGATGSETGFRVVAWAVALTFFGLAVYIWLAAIDHLRHNHRLKRSGRSIWYTVTYGGFIFGALAYYWTFMRGAPPNQT